MTSTMNPPTSRYRTELRRHEERSHSADCHCPSGRESCGNHITAPLLLQSLLDLRHLLAGEWNADILVVLQAGPRRYTELLDAVRTRSVADRHTGRIRYAQTRTFVYTLRRMEADGLLARHEQEGVWPREVRYELTPIASDLLAALASTVGWRGPHAPDSS